MQAKAGERDLAEERGEMKNFHSVLLRSVFFLMGSVQEALEILGADSKALPDKGSKGCQLPAVLVVPEEFQLL